MSLVPRSLHKMRIIAIPLTRPKPFSHGKADTRHGLIYYQFQISPFKQVTSNKTREKSTWLPEEGIVNFLQSKAATIWSGFGKSEEGSWKLKVYKTGERLMDRIDFEELALKSLDPTLVPSVAHASSSEKKLRIPLIYPPSLSSDTESLVHLRTLLDYRMPRHRRGFYLWMIIAPLTAPLMIIPVIPNLPFFFCVWRSWSHYKAYRSTRYLQALLAHGSIIPEPSGALDAIFRDFSSPVSTITGDKTREAASEGNTHEFVLIRRAVPAITSLFGLQESSNVDMYRAIEQARLRIEDKRST